MKEAVIFKSAAIIIIALIAIFSVCGSGQIIKNEKETIHLIFLKQKVLDFAKKYSDEDVIVVSKQDHLLYYCKNGRVVKNASWNGFTYNFPVKVALASRYYKTPEGEMYIDRKNPYSKYILFLSFSTPGAYGIHSAPTQYKAYLDKMEKNDPNFTFATKKDDTRGCVQVENRVIKYLYANVDVKTPVLVMP
ncbi:MAG: L,D-transpeptidase [Candidatus Saganbacteria bacterium]|nr:L,D-transpeptidase [Candidatus Saganbacteria bacterium]